LLTEESIFKEEEKFIISNYSIELFELKEKLKEENKKEAIFSNITTMEYY